MAVIRSKLLKLAATGAAAAVLPLGVAIVGAAPASAGPSVCVSGPYGMAHACVEGPGWAKHWYDGPPRKHWKKHHKHHKHWRD
ncbi:hypothetical protein [Mycolicibacterium thermoresistibile]